MQRKLLSYICTHVWSVARSCVCTHVWGCEDSSRVYTHTHVQSRASCVCVCTHAWSDENREAGQAAFVYVHMRGAMKTDPECIFIHICNAVSAAFVYHNSICTHVWSIAAPLYVHMCGAVKTGHVCIHLHMCKAGEAAICMYTCVER